ncbi:hypothetical protein LTR86_010852 [Recurvomyces mirabilis]|nr:hypothetical protein LTR86_010852 [Recurvomyces mirabilis]
MATTNRSAPPLVSTTASPHALTTAPTQPFKVLVAATRSKFVYFGAANGVGSGACQLISGTAPVIQGGTSNQNTLVAAILFVSYSGPAPTATASSVTFPPASSAAGGASSVIGPVVTQIVTATATTIVPLLPAVTYTVTYTTSH